MKKNIGYINNLIIAILFFAPLISKIIYWENFIRKYTSTQYFGAFQVVINDLMIYLALLLFIYISFLKIIPNYISIFLRIIVVILFSLYIVDYFIILNFNTHLTIPDISNYIAYAPKYILQVLIEFNLRTIILLISCTYLTISFIIHKWKLKGESIAHIGIISLIITLISLLFYIPKDKYVHAWRFKNFIDYNLTILSEAREYSSQFINDFEYEEEFHHSKNIKQKPNLIILMVESLSSYQSKFFSGIRDWTPSLDSIAMKNIAYKNFLANGFCSEDGTNAVLFGRLPLSHPGNFTDGGSKKGYLKLDENAINHSLPMKLKQQGYHTEFLAPYDLNYKDVGNWAYSMGFDYVEGQENKYYSNLPRFQYLSVEDKILYQRVLNRIKSNHSEPYLLSVFTASSHHPYKNPENGSESESEIFKYVDRQIGYFYRQLEKINFFDNGLLLIVGDHHAMVPLKKEEIKMFGYSRAPAMIPLVVVTKTLKPKIITSYHQQLDIYNSLSQINLDSIRHSIWVGNIFSDYSDMEQRFIHRRGDNRDIISIFTKNNDYRVKLDGDKTRIVEGKPPSYDFDAEIINKINWERINSVNIK